MSEISRYKALLLDIQNTISVEETNSGESRYANAAFIDIDWNTRTVTLPSEYKDYLSVQNDHRAATIYFRADRYFDDVDLLGLTAVVEYINANKEGRISPVVEVDYTTFPGKIVFGWKIGNEVTKTAGEIQFAVHIYTIDPETKRVIYSMNTQPCSAKILKTLVIDKDTTVQEQYDFEADEVTTLFARLDYLENKAVVWHDLTRE